MRSLQERIVLLSLLLSLICAVQVGSAQAPGFTTWVHHLGSPPGGRRPRSSPCWSPAPAQVASLPLPEDWSGLLLRTKRSLLWRWNSMKPLGGSCREDSECGTKYCRYGTRHDFPGFAGRRCCFALGFCRVQRPKAAPRSCCRRNVCSFYT